MPAHRQLCKHMHMHCMGDYYDIPRLRQYAVLQARRLTSHIDWNQFDMDDFCRAISLAYNLTLTSNRDMRDLFVSVVSRHYDEPLHIKSYTDYEERLGKLSTDIRRAQKPVKNWIVHCEECNE